MNKRDRQIYRWREATRHTVDPQLVGEAIEKVCSDGLGEASAPAVVEVARPVNSPLHPLFEWDDTVAGERYRENQARDVIRSLVVVAVLPEETVGRAKRAFLSVARHDRPGYVPSSVVLSDDELRAQFVRRAWDELRQWRDRYADYEEMAAVIAAVDSAIATARGAAPGGSEMRAGH